MKKCFYFVSPVLQVFPWHRPCQSLSAHAHHGLPESLQCFWKTQNAGMYTYHNILLITTYLLITTQRNTGPLSHNGTAFRYLWSLSQIMQWSMIHYFILFKNTLSGSGRLLYMHTHTHTHTHLQTQWYLLFSHLNKISKINTVILNTNSTSNKIKMRLQRLNNVQCCQKPKPWTCSLGNGCKYCNKIYGGGTLLS